MFHLRDLYNKDFIINIIKKQCSLFLLLCYNLFNDAHWRMETNSTLIPDVIFNGQYLFYKNTHSMVV